VKVTLAYNPVLSIFLWHINGNLASADVYFDNMVENKIVFMHKEIVELLFDIIVVFCIKSLVDMLF